VACAPLGPRTIIAVNDESLVVSALALIYRAM
jgi:hypothetical protein